jgi:hypothetical protein
LRDGRRRQARCGQRLIHNYEQLHYK